ncbi:hypothetical protein OPT61_g5984 [Boeremia exigua]|uniref:Uncharacterized protein n=1 Tax=Boeremia exigua TaxID=749465 RepID=A0ACC2I8G0_9PLEO|nr:hypothetical protein OPT61_g5984 [Boeremia exigua]
MHTGQYKSCPRPFSPPSLTPETPRHLQVLLYSAAFSANPYAHKALTHTAPPCADPYPEESCTQPDEYDVRPDEAERPRTPQGGTMHARGRLENTRRLIRRDERERREALQKPLQAKTQQDSAKRRTSQHTTETKILTQKKIPAVMSIQPASACREDAP